MEGQVKSKRKRVNAIFKDITLDKSDDEHIAKAFTGLIADLKIFVTFRHEHVELFRRKIYL